MFLIGGGVGPVAQLVEQLTFNQRVTGSNPVRLTTFNRRYLAVLRRGGAHIAGRIAIIIAERHPFGRVRASCCKR